MKFVQITWTEWGEAMIHSELYFEFWRREKKRKEDEKQTNQQQQQKT